MEEYTLSRCSASRAPGYRSNVDNSSGDEVLAHKSTQYWIGIVIIFRIQLIPGSRIVLVPYLLATLVIRTVGVKGNPEIPVSIKNPLPNSLTESGHGAIFVNLVVIMSASRSTRLGPMQRENNEAANETRLHIMRLLADEHVVFQLLHRYITLCDDAASTGSFYYTK
jgi:hypothetical protein